MHPLYPPINTTDGQFRDGNPATGEPGTIVSAEWLNRMQQATRGTQSELINLVKAAGMTLDTSDEAQVLKAVRSLSAADLQKHLDDKSGEVHPQYALKTQLGHYAGHTLKQAHCELLVSEAGYLISFNSPTAVNCNLPSCAHSNLTVGATYTILNVGQGAVTLKPAGVDKLQKISDITNTTREAILINQGESCVVTYRGDKAWLCHGGSVTNYVGESTDHYSFQTGLIAGRARSLYTPEITRQRGTYLVTPYSLGWWQYNANGSYYVHISAVASTGIISSGFVNLHDVVKDSALVSYNLSPFVIKVISDQASFKISATCMGHTSGASGEIMVTPGVRNIGFHGTRIG